MRKPADVHDRDHEWGQLDRFVSSSTPGAPLGLVYGRRRQGKTFLLDALAEAHGGFLFSALQQSSRQNLDRLARQLAQHLGTTTRPALENWEDAIGALLSLGEKERQPRPVVIDELPYLLDGAPELPSVLQAQLGARRRAGPARLIVCGSALSTMAELASGSAPLRGRASLELVVHPFDPPEMASFWGVDHDPELAVRLHALIGGTPAYRDMSGGIGPGRLDELDEWVTTALLDPASAMFREGDVLLAEEPGLTDRSLYHSVLTAVVRGRTRRGEIAAAVGRSEGAMAHPLGVLTDAQLVTRLDDALRQKRSTFHVAEPVIRLHQLIVAPNADRLVRHDGAAVWAEVADTVSSRIYGPHLEDLARWWCAGADVDGESGRPRRVAPTVVACREHGTSHEVDLVALGADDQVVAVGEAKWRTTPVPVDELDRLDHLAELLGAPDARRVLVARAGFTRGVRDRARRRGDVELVDLARLVAGA